MLKIVKWKQKKNKKTYDFWSNTFLTVIFITFSRMRMRSFYGFDGNFFFSIISQNLQAPVVNRSSCELNKSLIVLIAINKYPTRTYFCMWHASPLHIYKYFSHYLRFLCSDRWMKELLVTVIDEQSIHVSVSKDVW